MTPGTCAVPDCAEPRYNGSLCKRHYNRLWYEKKRKGNNVTLEELSKLKMKFCPRQGGTGGGVKGMPHEPFMESVMRGTYIPDRREHTTPAVPQYPVREQAYVKGARSEY